MLKSVEATIEADGDIHLCETIHLPHACRAIVPYRLKTAMKNKLFGSEFCNSLIFKLMGNFCIEGKIGLWAKPTLV